MASSNELLRQIDDITECPICAESFKNPKVLPCIHTFCLCCLEKYGEENNPGDKVNCPVCRKLFSIPSGGFKELPNNFFIIQMLQLRRSSADFAVQQAAECEVCWHMLQKSAATAYCMECGEHFCESCRRIHKAQKISRVHQVVDINDKPTGPELMKMVSQYCEQHPSDELKFYCYDCNMVACVVCYVTNKHNKHECCEVKISAEEFRVQIKKDTDNVMASASNCQQELKKLEIEINKFNIDADAICNDISQIYKKLRSILDQHQSSLMDELTSFRKTHMKEFEIRRDELERQSVIMESFKRYCDELKEKGTSADVSRVASDLHVRAEELVKNEEELTSSKLSSVEMKFMPSVENVNNWIGDLSFTRTTKPDVEVNFDATAFLHQSCTVVEVLTAKNVIHAIALLGSEVFAAMGLVTEIEVYDSCVSTVKRKLPIPGLAVAQVLAACPHYNCLYVSTADSNAILHRFNLSDNSTSQWSLTGHCFGLSITRDYNLLVSLYSSKRIQEYTTQGNLIRDISCSDGDPLYVAELSSGDLVVSLSTSHKVSVVNSSGQVLRSYGGGNLNHPYQLAIDKSDNVIVGDQLNYRIVLLSQALTLLGYIEIPGHKLGMPWALRLDDINRYLYIGEQSGRVLVLRASMPGNK